MYAFGTPQDHGFERTHNPHSWKPTPMNAGVGFHRYGCGFSQTRGPVGFQTNTLLIYLFIYTKSVPRARLPYPNFVIVVIVIVVVVVVTYIYNKNFS